MKIDNKWSFILLALPLAFMLAFFVVPFGLVALESIKSEQGGFTFASYSKALGDVYYWETLVLTFKLSLFVVVSTLLIGYPLAYFIVRQVRSKFVRSLLYIIVITPLFTSNIVRAFG